jgi:WhiB family redox-sensing transcriptional regulator
MSRSRHHTELLAIRTERPPFADRPDKGCADADPETFVPPHGDQVKITAEAKRICRRCPYAVECADWATRTLQQFGIWGGTTPGERIARRRTAA